MYANCRARRHAGVSAHHSTFAQHEKLHTGVLGVLAKQRMISKLRSDKTSIIELDKVTKHSRIPRINNETFFMTPVGKRTKKRATLEAEHWFCGNEGAL